MSLFQGFSDPQQWTVDRVLLQQGRALADKIAIEFVDGPEWSYKQCRDMHLAAPQHCVNSVYGVALRSL